MNGVTAREEEKEHEPIERLEEVEKKKNRRKEHCETGRAGASVKVCISEKKKHQPRKDPSCNEVQFGSSNAKAKDKPH